jgi:hypothetical protein
MAMIQCLCGEVGIEVTGEPVAQLYCHCDDCQLVHGAACVPTAIYRTKDVVIVHGEAREWRLRTTPRYACPNCATRLFAQGSEAFRGVNAYLLPPGTFYPTLHIYCRFAALPFADDLPHYATVPARWGGSDETVEWGWADGGSDAPESAHIASDEEEP